MDDNGSKEQTEVLVLDAECFYGMHRWRALAHMASNPVILITLETGQQAELQKAVERFGLQMRVVTEGFQRIAQELARVLMPNELTMLDLPEFATPPRPYYHPRTRTRPSISHKKQPNLAPFWGQKPQKMGRKHR